MMVTFVSQCEKKALGRSRRVLDSFAERIGSNTWQTVITQDGLLAVKKLLRKTATKNTAVSCHWIRSRSRSDLVWIVGRRDAFNTRGVVPVSSTQTDHLRTDSENNWHYLPLIKALTALAALLHDWGKASQLFQDKLTPNKQGVLKGDPLRHEWVSCLLFNAFVQSHQHQQDDRVWLQALTTGQWDEAEIQQVAAAQQTPKPLADLPPIAQWVAWLIVSHHRLPLSQSPDELKREKASSVNAIAHMIDCQWGYQNRYDDDYLTRVQRCFEFSDGLMNHSKRWVAKLKKWAQRLLDCHEQALSAHQEGSYRVVLAHARLCLMLGDHHYSSQNADPKWQSPVALFANTDRKTRQLKQKLDEHLVGVACQSVSNAHWLPAYETELPQAQDIAALKKNSPPAFRWQDNAVKAIKRYRKQHQQPQGFFLVNMASTGCGKTFANAKIMRALSAKGDSLRFVLALGLRSLTLQTGDEYRQRVGLDDSELAVLIGARAVLDLHQQCELDNEQDREPGSHEQSGSLSEEPLLDEAIDYDGVIPEEGLATQLRRLRDRQFLYAPVLACTIDHLMAATETQRGGRYILPTLRLMSSDLVIDEIDDFSGHDLIAIGRLIHLAGMLGRKVMISSATIPPDLAEGYFKAYRDGWQLFCKSRQIKAAIGCAWIDEFTTQVTCNPHPALKEAILDYRGLHKGFIDKRVARLAEQEARRKADIYPCEFIVTESAAAQTAPNVTARQARQQQDYFHCFMDAALEKHRHHHEFDPKTQLKLSFGLMRMANIKPCVDLCRYLLAASYPPDTDVRVMAYHSQQTLIMRHEQERHLDYVLKRKPGPVEAPALTHTLIRRHLDTLSRSKPEVSNVLFIVVATPVEEVGRDHDFDWAVVEPSSYRSIIQLAGRVRRHREGEASCPNISLLQYNWKGLRDRHDPTAIVFNRPGFEEYARLNSHNLKDLVDEQAIAQRLDATPRIQKPAQLDPLGTLVDLEHGAIAQDLATYCSQKAYGPANLQGYLRETWFLTALPQALTHFRGGRPSKKIFLVWNSEQERAIFCEQNPQGDFIEREQSLKIQALELDPLQRQRLWLTRDFMASIESLAQQQARSLRAASIRYGELSYPAQDTKNYQYSDQLGLVEQ